MPQSDEESLSFECMSKEGAVEFGARQVAASARSRVGGRHQLWHDYEGMQYCSAVGNCTATPLFAA